jgi:hypothetical protein
MTHPSVRLSQACAKTVKATALLNALFETFLHL